MTDVEGNQAWQKQMRFEMWFGFIKRTLLFAWWYWIAISFTNYSWRDIFVHRFHLGPSAFAFAMSYGTFVLRLVYLPLADDFSNRVALKLYNLQAGRVDPDDIVSDMDRFAIGG